MTVREDMIERANNCLAREACGDFGARIMRFAILGAMERMTEEELNRQIDESPGWMKEDVDIFKRESL